MRLQEALVERKPINLNVKRYSSDLLRFKSVSHSRHGETRRYIHTAILATCDAILGSLSLIFFLTFRDNFADMLDERDLKSRTRLCQSNTKSRVLESPGVRLGGVLLYVDPYTVKMRLVFVGFGVLSWRSPNKICRVHGECPTSTLPDSSI